MSDEQISHIPPDNPERKGPKPEIRYVPVEYIQEAEEDEVDILDFVQTLWEGKKIIAISTAIFVFLGVFHYMFGPEEYESSSVLIQETRSQGSQAQQLLQRLGGGNLGLGGGESGTLPPSLYPTIVQSIEFQHSLIFEEVEFESYGMTTTLIDYFNNYFEPPFREKAYKGFVDYSFRLPFTLYGHVRNLFRSDGSGNRDSGDYVQVESDGRILILSRDERRAIRELSSRVQIDMESNLVTVKTRLPDARAAAELNVILVDRIQEYITDYRLEKARQNLEFTEKQQMEAQQRYEEAQQSLARFRDQNVSLATATAQSELERLQDQRNLRFNVYNSISQQVEQARLTVQEETPVFSSLQKSSMPTSTVGGSFLIVIVAIVLGVVLGVMIIFTKKVYQFLNVRLRNLA